MSRCPTLDEIERRVPRKKRPRAKGESVPDHCRVPGLRWQAPKYIVEALKASKQY